MSENAPSPSSTGAWHPDASLPTMLERYQILGIIGQGGMGTVFKGYHVNLKRFVAIKTLRIDQIRRPDLVTRFRREMQSVGQMDHPNVVRATDAGEKNGVFYLVMEYLTGSDLSRLVAEKGWLEAADACELIRQAALGLDYIHQTLVHRDVKPSNLMLTPAGLVKVLDLGLARITEADALDPDRTPSAFVVGTYDYMAPEQAGPGAAIDSRADIYSLGCTLFKLLTGRAPFSGPEYSSAAKKLFAHSRQSLDTLAEFRSIPAGVGAVLLRMTAKDPAERHQKAADVAAALAPLAFGSQPARLLVRTEDADDPSVQPLPQPLPAELSRLTNALPETPLNTPQIETVRGGQRPHGWVRLLLGVALLAGALAAPAWFFLPALLNRPAILVTAPRALDELAAHTYHGLLDQPPFVAGDARGVRKWRWDEGQHALESKGGSSLLFQLGTTSRSRFTFEASMEQAPWTGRVGVFWGYHEDAAGRSARASGRDFAWFQMLIVWNQPNARGEDHYTVRRGKGTLRFDDLGELRTTTHYNRQQDVPMLGSGENILVVVIDHNRLVRALLGSAELPTLCSEDANKAFQDETYQGSIGLITLGHNATFSNARFRAASSD